jgi:hypothetical protein
LLRVVSTRDATIISRILRLGDGRAALRPPRSAEIADEGANDAALIDAVVLQKPSVLGGDECFLHDIRYFGEWVSRHGDCAARTDLSKPEVKLGNAHPICWQHSRSCRTERSYFGKSAQDLSVTEGAMLAGLLKGPSFFNPDRHPGIAPRSGSVTCSAACKTTA